MASISRDPRSSKGVWYCSYTASGRRVMRSTGTRSKAEAKIICQAWEGAERAAAKGHLSQERVSQILNETLARCGIEPVRRYTLEAWFSEWLSSKTQTSPGLQNGYRFAVTKLLEFLGPDSEKRFLDSIKAAELAAFATHLKAEGRCATTVRKILNALSGAFNRALVLGYLRTNPFRALEPEKDDGLLERRKTFSSEQIVALVGTARGSDWEGAILFGYSTGARLSDVANLRWEAIDPLAGVVVFRQRKTGRETIAGLHPDFADWLARGTAPDDPGSFVFPSLANRSPGGKNGLSDEFSALLDRAGIDAGRLRDKHGTVGRSRRNLSFHSLRHTAVSLAYNASAVKEVVRHVSGHAQNGSLERYIHVDLAAIKSASALIPRLPL